MPVRCVNGLTVDGSRILIRCRKANFDQLPVDPWLCRAEEEASVGRGGLGGDPAAAAVGGCVDLGDREGVRDLEEHGEGGGGR